MKRKFPPAGRSGKLFSCEEIQLKPHGQLRWVVIAEYLLSPIWGRVGEWLTSQPCARLQRAAPSLLGTWYLFTVLSQGALNLSRKPDFQTPKPPVATGPVELCTRKNNRHVRSTSCFWRLRTPPNSAVCIVFTCFPGEGLVVQRD